MHRTVGRDYDILLFVSSYLFRTPPPPFYVGGGATSTLFQSSLVGRRREASFIRYSRLFRKVRVRRQVSCYSIHEALISALEELYSVYKLHLEDSTIPDTESKLHKKDVCYEKLRAARQSMSQIFPLTPAMWISWLEDEKLENKDCDLNSIFKKATGDYYSVDLWLKWIEYQMSTQNETDIRKMFEEALMVCGLDYHKGHLVWQLYIDYETTYLEKMDTICTNTLHQKQLDVLLKLYQRRLQVPSPNLDFQHNELIEFVDKYYSQSKGNILDVTNINLRATKAKLSIIEPFEEELVSSEDKLSAFVKYIDMEDEPNRKFNLFERAVTEHCLEPIIWHLYLDFVEDLKSEDIYDKVYKRALRNITSDFAIYAREPLKLEKEGASYSRITDAYFNAIFNTSNTLSSDGFCSLWIIFLSFEWHRAPRIAEQKSERYKLVNKALGHIESLMTDERTILRFIQFWVDLENDVSERVQMIWTYAFDKYIFSSVRIAALIALKDLAEPEKMRKLFKLALHAETFRGFDGTAQREIMDHWMRYEAVHGTTDTLSRVNSALTRIDSKKLDPYSRPTLLSSVAFEKMRRAIFLEDEAETEDKENLKRKKDSPTFVKDLPLKKYKSEKSTELAAHQYHDSSIESSSTIGPQLPSGPASESTIDEPQLPPTSEKDNTESKKSFRKKRRMEDRDPSKTIYVANLDHTVSEEEMIQFFKDAGHIDDCEVVHSSRGCFALVEFATSEGAEKALEFEHRPLHDRPVFVNKFVLSKHKKPNKETNYSDGLNKTTLYVAKIPSAITSEVLDNHFRAHGVVKALRFVKRNDDFSFAFVEYHSEADAAKALADTPREIHGQNIQVDYSNPSSKTKKTEKMETGKILSRKQSLRKRIGGGDGTGSQREIIRPTRKFPVDKAHPSKRTPESYPSRRLEVSSGTSNEPPPEAAEISDAAESLPPANRFLSNSEFRDMFLKKN